MDAGLVLSGIFVDIHHPRCSPEPQQDDFSDSFILHRCFWPVGGAITTLLRLLLMPPYGLEGETMVCFKIKILILNVLKKK